MNTQVIVRPRRGGKTTGILKMMAQDPVNATFITFSAAEAKRTFRLAQKMFPEVEWDPERFLSYEQLHKSRGRTTDPLYVDNAEIVLSCLLQREVYFEHSVQTVTADLPKRRLFRRSG